MCRLDFEGFLAELAEGLELPREKLTLDFALKGNPLWDSLAIITVMAAVDERFHVELENEQLIDLATLGDLLHLIEEQMNARN